MFEKFTRLGGNRIVDLHHENTMDSSCIKVYAKSITDLTEY